MKAKLLLLLLLGIVGACDKQEDNPCPKGPKKLKSDSIYAVGCVDKKAQTFLDLKLKSNEDSNLVIISTLSNSTSNFHLITTGNSNAEQTAPIMLLEEKSTYHCLTGTDFGKLPLTKSKHQPKPDSEPFILFDEVSQTNIQTYAALKYSGKYCKLYMQDGIEEPSVEFWQQAAANFDDIIYPKVVQALGAPMKNVDGVEQIYIVFSLMIDDFALGYFNPYNAVNGEESNLKDMIVLSDDLISLVNLNALNSVMAHEFTHLVHAYRRWNMVLNPMNSDEQWIQEGIATLMEHIVGFGVLNSDGYFASDLQYLMNKSRTTSLHLVTEENVGPLYRLVFLFFLYLHEHYANLPVNLISGSKYGTSQVEDVTDEEFDVLFGHFLGMLYLNGAGSPPYDLQAFQLRDSIDGYKLPGFRALTTVRSYPYDKMYSAQATLQIDPNTSDQYKAKYIFAAFYFMGTKGDNPSSLYIREESQKGFLTLFRGW
jgi:hypothetical protein